MRKVFLCLAFVGMFYHISAQEVEETQISMPKHEVYGGFGLLNDNQVGAMLADVISAVVTLGYLVEPGSYKAFTPFVGYRYCFTNRFSLGGAFAYDVNSVKVFNEADRNNKREVNRHYMTFALEPKFNYVSKPSFQLYGYLGLGVTVVGFADATFDNGSKVKMSRVPFLNVHVTPLGVRFGNEFGGFVELGYGYKGILDAGISYRF